MEQGRRPNVSICAGRSESTESAIARAAINPSLQASITIQKYDQTFGDLDIDSLSEHLNKQINDVHGGSLKSAETLLVSQAVTLDALFHNLSRRAINETLAIEGFERLLRLGLKVQSQSRATLETLGKIKNPQPIAFVRQANIAHGPQQINNGAASCAGELISAPNELMELCHEERLDTRAPRAAGATNPHMEAVGAILGAID